MSGYGRFAYYYDRLTENVDYGKIAARCDELIKKYSSEKEVVVDLACGTGSLSEALAKLDYDVVGVDLSQQMLEEAMDKRYDSGLNIQYLCQDMTELDLYGAADAVICVLDSINHLESVEAVQKTIESVSKFTCDGGMFIFDVNTAYKHREILADNAFCYDLDGLFCAWQNELNDDDSVNIYLDFFEQQEDGSYERFSEDFTERIYDDDMLCDTLKKQGFELIGKFDGFEDKAVSEDTQRILYVCKRLNRG